MPETTIHVGDCLDSLRAMPAESVHTCVTSPPYWGLRDYGHDGQLGLEPSPAEYVAGMVSVFEEVRRVLRDDGTLWLNLGDSYAGGGGGNYGSGLNVSAHQTNPSHLSNARRFGLKPKDLVGIPWRVAFALQDAGWYLRSDIIWAKGNPMPESVTDRPTRAHEYLFLLSKSARYHYDHEAVKEEAAHSTQDRAHLGKRGIGPKQRAQIEAGIHGATDSLRDYGRETRNRRSVWSINTRPFRGAHFAVFPPELVEPCVLAGCPEGGTVLDPFGGAGTTALVANAKGRDAVLCELNPEYAAMAAERVRSASPLFSRVSVLTPAEASP